MNQNTRVAVSLVLAVFATLLSGCGRPGDGREGGSDKRECSILQSVSSTHKGQTIDQPEVIRVEEYMIICVPRHDDGTRIWIMADPQSPPFYKQMPEGNFWLTKEQLEEIRKQAKPITTVLDALKSHLK